jgi:hypothetical protein
VVILSNAYKEIDHLEVYLCFSQLLPANAGKVQYYRYLQHYFKSVIHGHPVIRHCTIRVINSVSKLSTYKQQTKNIKQTITQQK